VRVETRTSGKRNAIHIKDEDFRSRVTVRRRKDGTMTGLWSSWLTGGGAAHEAGHLMGLQDRYTEGIGPDPGWKGNIMAEPTGNPDSRNINAITSTGFEPAR